jgi:glycosyltransferase involved in cell wall biosynthesis
VSRSERTLVLLANATRPHTIKWAEHFNQAGWKVFVLSFETGEPLAAGVSIIPLAGMGGNTRYIFAAPAVRGILRRIKPDIIHAHYATGYGLLGSLTARGKYVLSVWGSDIYEYPRRSRLHALLLKLNLRRADYVCSTSRSMAEETQRYTAKPITITPFGIDCDIFAPGPHNQLQPSLTIGTVKTLDKPYGVEYLIRAFAHLRESNPPCDVKLVIAGDGPLRGSLENLARTLGVAERVRFLGQIEQSTVPAVLRTFDIFAALSLRESFGVAVLEASACGVPIVASNVDGLPEVVDDGVTGFLVPPADPFSAASALLRLVADRTLRVKMGAAGRAFVLERYEWGKTARIMDNLYESILNEAPSRERGFTLERTQGRTP